MATGKSDPQGGQRSQVRHNVDNLGMSGFAWVAINRLAEADYLSTAEATAIFGGVVVVGSGFLKWASSKGLGDRILKKLGLVGLVLVMLSGCGISVGHVVPHEFTGANGQTIIACTVTGVQLGIGDGGVCRNVEGGHVSKSFADLFTGTLEAAGRIIGGVFMGLGSAGAAIAPAAPAADPAPVADAPVAEGLFGWHDTN